jgi:ribonuclease HI
VQQSEDVAHLLFQYDTARQIWSSLGITNIIDDALLTDRVGSAVLEHLLRGDDATMPSFNDLGLKETIGVACWYIRWIRHRHTHGETVPPIYKCKMSILPITLNAAKVGAKSIPNRIKWENQVFVEVKVNTDGSFFRDSHSGSVAAVTRNSEGGFLAASSIFLPNISSVAACEALAMREGLALANRFGCSNVIMESDSMETVDACSGNEVWRGESSAIFAHCLDLATLIDNVWFKHCPREANGVAHELARNSFCNQSSCNWIDEAPSFIISKLIDDVIIL